MRGKGEGGRSWFRNPSLTNLKSQGFFLSYSNFVLEFFFFSLLLTTNKKFVRLCKIYFNITLFEFLLLFYLFVTFVKFFCSLVPINVTLVNHWCQIVKIKELWTTVTQVGGLTSYKTMFNSPSFRETHVTSQKCESWLSLTFDFVGLYELLPFKIKLKRRIFVDLSLNMSKTYHYLHPGC